MSSIGPKRGGRRKSYASVFAALGDETRLTIIGKLSSGAPLSISRLTAGSKMTRQAITKHLRVLEDAGVVRNLRIGRESLFEFRLEPFKAIQKYLELVSDQRASALAKLKTLAES